MKSFVIVVVIVLVFFLIVVVVERFFFGDVEVKIESFVVDVFVGCVVGFFVVFVYDGEIVFEKGYGMIEVEYDVVIDVELIFCIGLIIKQFIVVFIMKQVEVGEIGLDDLISKYVDFLIQGKEVIVCYLLMYIFGIKSYIGFGVDWIKIVFFEMMYDELFGFVDELLFDFDFGIKYCYNNMGYYFFGVIFEEVLGKSFVEFLV